MTTRVLDNVGRSPGTAADALVGQICRARGPVRTGRPPHCRRGSALLAVLWLSAALSAIAFTVANTVRAETERTATEVDSLRAYYLAAGAIDRAILYIQWGPGYRNGDGTPKYFQNPMPVLQFNFPSGTATAEIIPETSKLNVNSAPANEMLGLLLAVGAPPDQAATVVQGILDWRAPSPGGSFTQFDQYYLSLAPSFRARHASFQEIEELLLIRGVTPDLFYGSYTNDGQGRLLPHAGLRDCLSVYGATGPFDANTVQPAVMQAIGISPDLAAAIVNLRRATPISNMGQLAPFSGGGPGMGRLSIVPSPIVTLRATARLRLANGQFSDFRRTVSAMVKFLGPEWNPPFHIMRWYDNAASIQ
jgi:general secretion pathway protein K